MKIYHLKSIIVLFVFAMNYSKLCAQITDDELDRQITQSLENSGSAEGEDEALNDLAIEFQELLKHPVNINSSNETGLLKVPGMTVLMANSIILHRKKYGNFLSLYELQAVAGIDFQLLKEVIKYLSVGDNPSSKITFPTLILEGRNELWLISGRRLQESAGYKSIKGKDLAYKGNPYRMAMRYRYSFSNRLLISFSGEKDAGEQFLKGSNKYGFDFNSFNLTLKNTGRLKMLVIGDFQSAFGQGLTFGTAAGFGKSANVQNVKRNANGLRPFRSFTESGFMRGIGAGFKLNNKLMLTSFVSYKKSDATIHEDTLGDYFTSISVSGYHRTENEIKSKNSSGEMILGSNLSYDLSKFHLGFTAVSKTYSNKKVKNPDLYRLFDSQGKNNTSFGADYHFLVANILAFGEISANGFNKSVSYINGMVISLDKTFDIAIVNRNYSVQYSPVSSNAFSEAGSGTNEKGTYIGASLNAGKGVTLNAYYDIFRFPWLKYRIAAPSQGNDVLFECRYSERKKFAVYTRYRREQKMQDLSVSPGSVKVQESVCRRTFRVHLESKISDIISIHSRIESSFYSGNNKSSKGIFLFQDFVYSGLKKTTVT
ncbi:MAG: helix-hairpin-helix domain-containing protein, partial [Bacteroidia bacterium]|nr:helix-hairpin-helix domain-containing protein [Bacteroidia bacterium]